jgi:ubiquinone/menaquinone biosynthesis C-methylase UbiE
MDWRKGELERLLPILEGIGKDLVPLAGKRILVLCSAAGDVALWLGERAGSTRKVIGLELSDELLLISRRRAEERGLAGICEFRKAERERIPYPEGKFDALVSEFILYPTPLPTEIGQREMARVLKSGGQMVLTDVIATKPVSEEEKKNLAAVGLDYLCQATQEDFRSWMEEADLVDVAVWDLTPLLQGVWEKRAARDPHPGHRQGYRLLLEDTELKLGEGIFYIYVRGRKPA